jgi:DHA2 family multidrug resistance protein
MNADGTGSPTMTRRRTWLVIAAGTLGAFMALLDTSIVNSSLPVIQGEIGATRSEATWVGTAYLLTEIVILPLTAWIERMLGLRRFLLWSAILFTGFSVLCGSAGSLPVLIFGRLGQGMSGGMMIPSAYSLVGRLLPPEEQGKAFAVISLPILAAPIVGPVVGGWLTEQISWHFAFFINVPFCAVLLLLLFAGVEDSPMDLSEITGADWLGVAGVTMFLGCLTIVLEKGHTEQWFESALIWKLSFGLVAGLVLLALGQLRPGRPVIKLALLRHRVLASAMMIQFMAGFILFSTLFLVPQFLVAIGGYNAFRAGLVVSAAGLSSLGMMFVYPLLMSRANLKLVLVGSIVSLALACLKATDLTADSNGSSFFVTQLVVGASISMAAISLQQIVIAYVEPADIPDVTSLITIARNIGASVGLAGLASFEDARLDFHHWRLAETMGANDPAIQQTLSGWTALFGGGPEGVAAALQAMDGRLLVDALVMTFSDGFLVLALVALVVAPLGLLIPSRMPGGAQGGPMH